MEKLNDIRCIVTDLDGTLLNNRLKISDENKKALQKARNQGILTGICTGRPAETLVRQIDAWDAKDCFDFALGFNGGMRIDLKDGTKEKIHEMETPAVKAIVESFESAGLWVGEYQDGIFYCTKSNFITRRMASRNRLGFELCRPEELFQPALKVMGIGMPWKISKYLKTHQTETEAWRMFRSGPFLIEAVAPALSKEAGVALIRKEHGFTPQQTLVFGNDNNDLEMIEANIGVAMANGLPSLKEKADFIAGSNSQSGVGRFIETRVLKEN